jgi:hypothetical protein
LPAAPKEARSAVLMHIAEADPEWKYGICIQQMFDIMSQADLRWGFGFAFIMNRDNKGMLWKNTY